MSGTPAGSSAAAPGVYRPLTSLSSLSFAVHSAFDAEGLVAAIAEHVLDLTRADRLSLLLLDGETGELEGDHFERGRRGRTGHGRAAPGRGGFLAQVLRRETLLMESGRGLTPAERESLGYGSGASETWIGVPILVGTSLLGLALLGYARPVRLTDRRRRSLRYLADQIGLAIDRLRAREQLESKTARLEEARSALRRADDARSELISVVSHELRTPLTAIKAYTETLLDNVGNDSFTMHERFLGIINEECDRLSRMVNDVLDLSRMDSGKRRLRAEPLLVNELLDEILPTLEPQLSSKKVVLECDLAEDLPVLEADPDLLKQVLVNLIHNAVKFTPEGTTIRVRAARDGERLRIAVEDEGTGIPGDKLARVFEPFYRIEGAGVDRAGGTGLGLAIVKSVVELHGGAVEVESEVGRGTRFTVRLPLLQRGFRTLMESLEPFFEAPELGILLQSLVEMVAQVMDARIVSLMFFNADASELVIRAAHGLDPDTVARTRVKTGSSIAGWVAQTGENLIVNDIESDRRFRKLNHPQYETRSLLCIPFRIAGETVGVVNVSSKGGGVDFDADDLSLLAAITKRAGVALERARGGGRDGVVAAMLHSVRTITRARRSQALRNSRRGFRLATELGRRLGLPEDEVELLGYVARVHDVGMLSVGEDLLLSSRRWTAREHEQVEQHPQEGIQLLRPLESTSRANEIILCHHEHFDGGGYPRGLRGDAIPVASRILAVVDAFDAMTIGRPYRDPIPEEDALAELERCAGTQFDPAVVRALRDILTLAVTPPGASGEPREYDRDPVR